MEQIVRRASHAAVAVALGITVLSPVAAPIEPAALPGWSADALDGVQAAIDRQCALRRPPEPWPALCSTRPAAGESWRDWLQTRFAASPLASATGGDSGLLTGYHEPQVDGSRVRESTRQVAVLAPPADATRRMRTREAIERDAAAADDAWLWLDDPVEAFFLHIQGSGQVRLRDGSTIRIGYAADNGHTYRAIGRELVERRHLAAGAVDATTIKRWLREHPREAGMVMWSNPRYIYFRELPSGSDGPIGALGVALTPGRSIATDPVHVAPGSLLWLDSTDPLSAGPLRRLAVSQDTGAAIKGPIRVDLFWGSDQAAATAASATHHRLRAWRLTPK